MTAAPTPWLRLRGDRFVPAAETPETCTRPEPPTRRPRSYGCWDGDELAGCEHLDAEEDAEVLDALRDAGAIE